MPSIEPSEVSVEMGHQQGLVRRNLMEGEMNSTPFFKYYIGSSNRSISMNFHDSFLTR